MHARVRRRTAIAIVAIAAGVLAGGAAAFWLAFGSGTTGSQAGNVTALTLSSGTAITPLFPAGTADVGVSIQNTNPTRIFVGSLLLDTSQGSGGFGVDGGHSGCNLAALSYTTQTNGGAGWFIAANSTRTLDLAGAAALAATAVSACQGAQVSIYLKVGP
jgi:hypothetical protein